jgi:conjugative relaxase-like TrwC/TraI family protein
MLTIATLRNLDYYADAAGESFGYYGEHTTPDGDPPGQWAGELARRCFGDKTRVRRDDFAALFHGIHPVTGQPLTRTADALGFAAWRAVQALEAPDLSPKERRLRKREAKRLRNELRARGDSGHRAGIDLTFSAPKDFSLLVAAASPEERHRLLAAWRRSVETTLTDAERRYAKTRTRDEDGNVRTESVAGFCCALHAHLSARPVGDAAPDPDAHLHAVIFSPVLCNDETTRSLFSNDLRRNLKVMDAQARARLAQELAGMGYAVIPDRQPHCTSFHLPGVTPELRARYSKRRGQILDGLASGDFQRSSVAALGTRQGKGDWQRADALAAWQADFARLGFDASAFQPTGGEALPAPRSDAEVLDALLSMKAHFSARELRQALWEEAQFAPAPEGMDIGAWVEARAARMLASPELLHATLPNGQTTSRQRTATADPEPVFTTRGLLLRELALDEEVAALGQRHGHGIPWPEAGAIIAALEQRKSADAGTPFSYRDDQRAAIGKILAGPDIGFLQAMAGSGKTTAAAAMMEVWRTRGIKVVALAPSNKAARQLSEDCGLTGDDAATTVDAFLLGRAKDAVDASTVIFVDESSMCGFDHTEALVLYAHKRGCKIIFQGDKGQLPSVQRGRAFVRFLEQRMGTEAAELTVITRQREDWAKQATEAAARGDFAATLDLLDEHGQIHTGGTDEAVLDRIVHDHLADPQPVGQKLIVASRNADVDAINHRVRRELVARREVAEGLPCFAGKGELRRIRLGAGDRIVFKDTLKAGRRKLAANGSLGTVLSVAPAGEGLRVRVQLDGERRVVEFDTREFAAFKPAFCLSIHASQGATAESTRYLYSDFISSELAYVAMSRHRSTFGLYCREDQRQDMARFMGRGIEKLDARDIVSLADLNAAAAKLRERDADFARRARDFLRQTLPTVFKRTVAEVKKLAAVEWTVEAGHAADGLLDGLRSRGKALAERVRSIVQPAPQPAMESVVMPMPDIAAQLHAMRSRRSGRNQPEPSRGFQR